MAQPHHQAHVTSHGCVGFRAIPRRAALQVGSFGAFGLSLADFFRIRAARGEASTDAYSTAAGQGKLPEKIKAVIQLNLGGGFPQHESFDPKPEAPVEYRGSFGVVKTKNGDIFSDNLPKTAAIADKFTVIRSMVGKIPDHGLATYHLSTGYTPTAVIDYPAMGSIISHELGPRGLLPPYIAVPARLSYGGGTGFLSSSHGAYELGADPGQSSDPAQRKNFKVRDFSLPEGFPIDRFDRRHAARRLIEKRIRSLEADPTTLDTMDGFYGKAYELLTSADAQKAFTFEGETDETFELYGSAVTGGIRGPDGKYHPKGLAERLIIARRLVEAGTRFVTVNYGAWDCHIDCKRACIDQMAPLDHAITGLVTDLDRRGLLDTTLFWVTSEFGRTPKINKDSGRDHWARCYSNLVAGGGFHQGLIYGASDSTAAEPARDAVPLEDLMFTIYHQMGIDADKELVAFGTRPIEIIKDGRLVKGLIA
jgi:hypothetical protein